MSILIGHASIDENSKASGGQAGDQTGKEVYIGYWYSGNWNVVLRPISSTVAEKMATACETLCKGNLVGYDQGQRNTLWDELEKVGWDAKKLKTKCETDCSAFMTACARVAGLNIPRVFLGNGQYNAPVTWTMRNAFSSTGAFQVLTDSKYMTSDKYLKRGDILVRESGHTAMALQNGSQANATTPVQNTNTINTANTIATAKPTTTATSIKEVKASEPAYHRDTSLTGRYKCTASDFLSVRDGAGKSKTELAQIKPGEIVNTWGYYNTVGNVKWLYVAFTQNGISYIGYACENYLKKL